MSVAVWNRHKDAGKGRRPMRLASISSTVEQMGVKREAGCVYTYMGETCPFPPLLPCYTNPDSWRIVLWTPQKTQINRLPVSPKEQMKGTEIKAVLCYHSNWLSEVVQFTLQHDRAKQQECLG